MAVPLLSAEALAGQVGVAKDTVHSWIADRALPAHKVGRLWKFLVGEIDDWVQRGGAANDFQPSPPG